MDEKLKSARLGKGVNVSELAKSFSFAVSKLSKTEDGSQDIIANELQKICENLEIDPKGIMDGKNNLASHYNHFENNLVEKFSEAINKYKFVTKENFAGNKTIKIITESIPRIIKKTLYLDSQKFLVEGSCGKSRPANVPWLAIFINDITVSAQNGFYLVFLIKADLSGMYLSLNQGFTYFKEKYGTKEGKIKIKNIASRVRNIITTIPEGSLSEIDLACVKGIGKDYGHGNIAAKYYSIDNMPSDNELINDIREYITSYEEIRGIIGNRTVEQFYDYLLLIDDGYELNEDGELESIEKVLASGKRSKEETAEFKGEKKPKKGSVIDNKGKKAYPRDTKVAANSIKIAEYKCEVDENHASFIRRSNGKNYTESHHLIPLNWQGDFEFSLDVEENICSVCSNCHNCIHYGSDEERVVLLKQLYNERKDHLDKVGLNTSFDDLKKYYKIGKSL
ncbi:DUF3578 domain-containing protein [Bacillus sp. BAU-SS-2023]|nr:DUF3578 domain-containing protein [Bacillus sp. BAU-SS-2023]